MRATSSSSISLPSGYSRSSFSPGQIKNGERRPEADDRRGLVLVAGRHGEAERERIRGAAGDAPVEFVQSARDRPDLVERATVVAGDLDDELLARARNLIWRHSWAAGVDHELTDALSATSVTLTSSAGNGAIPLAEHAMLLMLMLNRDAPRWLRAQAEHRWDRFEHGELNGLTCGIIGLGHSGSDLAAKAAAFHMRVLGVRRRAHLPVPGVDRIYPPDRLHDVLNESDFVVVTAPYTPDTAGMFGEAEFAAMSETSCFVCFSRGGIVDDDALLTALREGWIAGAGLDAHGNEPLPPDSPFWDLPHVIITPHNGATTAATRQRGLDIFVDNLARFTDGRPLRNVVDTQVGY
ncbi:D-2-hydroxyacid dehydrogenase [Phytoactinopolyspora halotolerans]|uniref:D-2-hydroxyacid dehydrogenase n=1 Tax=Phytoactinopolyspora halotolerans TaxID=1981512 RepID=UPI0028A738C0|nr:D-2-hydroxyacid dehydrogenase [Phytoactinopolyspora halotolerans]